MIARMTDPIMETVKYSFSFSLLFVSCPLTKLKITEPPIPMRSPRL